MVVWQMYALRKLMQGSQEIPKAPLGNNARPLQPLHHRTVRTNIDFQNTDNALVTLFTTCILKIMKQLITPK